MTIFAHPDDEAFSAGGILARYAEIGSAVAVCVTRDEARIKEFRDSCSILGAKPVQLDFQKVTPANASVIRQKLVEIIKEEKPSTIVTHVDFDYHHEHRLVRDIVEEAVEWASHTTSSNAHQVQSLWAAETTVLIPSPHILVDISGYNEKRLEAIRIYATQAGKGGKDFYLHFHSKRTELRGIQSGVNHAEAFVQVPISLSGSFKPNRFFETLP